MVSDETLADWVDDARERSLEIVSDLSDERMMGPRLAIVNPLLWEIGHGAWFQERWVLRHCGGEKPIREDGDSLFDSISIAHDTRWDLPLPSREEMVAYLREVRARVLRRIGRGGLSGEEAYHIRYSLLHEDMHTEAYTYSRQTLGDPPPASPSLRAGIGRRRTSGAARFRAMRRSPAAPISSAPCRTSPSPSTTRNGPTPSR